MKKIISVFSYVMAILAGISILYIIFNLDFSIFTRSIGPLVSGDLVMDLETLYMWRERVIDTVLQTLVLASALLGVLALLIKGGRGG